MADRDVSTAASPPPPVVSPVVPAAAALCAGWTAGVFLADVDLRWAALPGYWFTDTLTRGAFALVIAVGAGALAVRAAGRTLWAMVGLAALVVLSVELALSLAPAGHPDLLRSIGSAAAGLVLGCAGAAAWRHHRARTSLLLGVVAGWATALPWMYAVDGTVLRLLPAAAAAVTAGVAARWDRTAADASAHGASRVALAGALCFGGIGWLVGGWLGNGATPGSFVTIGVAGLIGVTVATEWCARHTTTTDRRFVPAVVAATAGLMPVVVALTVPRSPGTAIGLTAVGVAGIVTGLAGAQRATKAAPIGWAVLAAIPAIGFAYPSFGTNPSLLAAGVTLAGIGSGLAIGATAPERAPVAVLGLGAIAPVSVLLAEFFDTRAVLIYRPAAGPADGADPAGQLSALQGYVSLPWPVGYRFGALCMAVLIACCAWSAFRRRAQGDRPAGPPVRSRDAAPRRP